jgi:hypothetical protein
VVFFGNKFEDLPVTQRVGDIIRVHRATLTEYRGSKYFTANVCYNSSWALFSPLEPREANSGLGFVFGEDEGVKPQREFVAFKHYGKNYSPVLP